MQTGHKIKSSSGFSLMELLVTTLILGMVSSVVAGGIPVARNAYNKVTVSANAQLLLSTTISALRSQLGPAKISKDAVADNGISFISGNTGAISRIYLDGEDKVLTIQEYSDTTTSGSTPMTEARPLVPGTDDLYATYTAIQFDYDKNMVTIQGCTVNKKNSSQKYVNPVDLSIRVIGNSKHD